MTHPADTRWTWRTLRRAARGRWARGHLAAVVVGLGLTAGVTGGRLPVHHGAPPGGPALARAAAPPTSAPTAAARVLEAEFSSPALGGRTMPYTLFLPPGYDSAPERRYPVLYMLHGMGGSFREWRDYGLLDTADRLMRAGELPPFIIVLPQGDTAYWMNHAGGGPRWGSYIATDLVGTIDAAYRTLPEASARAIGGMSMGGHGALQLALTNPGLFSSVGAHSLVLRRHEQAPAYFGDRAHFQRFDPVSLVQARPEAARGLRLTIDIGEADGWRAACAAFHAQLDAAGIRHAYRELPGGHDAAYWSANLTDYLRFYGEGFVAVSAPLAPAAD